MPKFRTHWDPIPQDAESYIDEVSITEPGRSESLQHLVERLTHRPNATMRDISNYIMATGQNFEDPTQMSDDEMSDRLERAVVKGDNMDAAETLANAVEDLAFARSGVVVPNEKEQAMRVTTSENTATEQVPGERRSPNEGASA